MTRLGPMLSYLQKLVIIFLLMVSPAPLLEPAAAQTSAAPCPAGYWHYATLCLNNSTGDVVLAAAAPGQDYPTRPITVIVPFVAGGASTTLVRILAERMNVTLGQSLVVEN